MNARTPKQKSANWKRAYHSKERVMFVRSLPCSVCGAVPSHNAHTKSGGMGRKADYDTIIPLCFRHHQEQHVRGDETFRKRYKLNYERLAARTEQAWLNHQGAP